MNENVMITNYGIDIISVKIELLSIPKNIPIEIMNNVTAYIVFSLFFTAEIWNYLTQ